MTNDLILEANKNLHDAKARLGKAHAMFSVTLRCWAQNQNEETAAAHKAADTELTAAGKNFQAAQRELRVTADELFRSINSAREVQ